MRLLLIIVLLSVGSLVRAADVDPGKTPRQMIEDFARCNAYYNMSYFFWGSRNDRQRTRFYQERVELTFVYATQLGAENDIDENVFANGALTHRNLMMSEIDMDLNLIGTLSRTYEARCETQMAQIPPEVVEHYETIKYDLRTQPQI